MPFRMVLLFLYFYCSYVVFSYDLRILRNKKFLTISLTRGNKTTLLSRNDLLFIMCQWHALGPEVDH